MQRRAALALKRRVQIIGMIAERAGNRTVVQRLGVMRLKIIERPAVQPAARVLRLIAQPVERVLQQRRRPLSAMRAVRLKFPRDLAHHVVEHRRFRHERRMEQRFAAPLVRPHQPRGIARALGHGQLRVRHGGVLLCKVEIQRHEAHRLRRHRARIIRRARRIIAQAARLEQRALVAVVQLAAPGEDVQDPRVVGNRAEVIGQIGGLGGIAQKYVHGVPTFISERFALIGFIDSSMAAC